MGQVLIDSRGAGLAVLGTPRANGIQVLEVAEERSKGLWASHDPATALGGRTASCMLAAGPDGTAMLIWVEALTDEGIFVASRAPSGAWADPRPGDSLSFPRGAVEPSIASAPTGEWLASWSQFTSTGTGVAVARRRSFDRPWERPSAQDEVLSPPIFFANAPIIAMSAGGDALITWYQSNTGPLKTYLSERKGANGAFRPAGMNDFISPPEAPVASGNPTNPRAALGPRGEAAVVWSQEDGHGQTSVYLATREPDGAWKKPSGLADTFSRHAGVTRNAQIAFGPGGDLYIVWSQREKGLEVIYAARRTPDGTWLDPGTKPELLSTPGVTSYSPSLAVGPDGGVACAWLEAEAGGRIMARRTGSDRRGWMAIERLSDDARGSVGTAAVAIGGADRALAAFTQGPIEKGHAYFAAVE